MKSFSIFVAGIVFFYAMDLLAAQNHVYEVQLAAYVSPSMAKQLEVTSGIELSGARVEPKILTFQTQDQAIQSVLSFWGSHVDFNIYGWPRCSISADGPEPEGCPRLFPNTVGLGAASLVPDIAQVTRVGQGVVCRLRSATAQRSLVAPSEVSCDRVR